MKKIILDKIVRSTQLQLQFFPLIKEVKDYYSNLSFDERDLLNEAVDDGI